MFRKFVGAIAIVLGALLIIGLVGQPASADTTLATPLKVNFQAQDSAVPSGYLADYGQAYDANRGYGWVSAATGASLSLVGNGRDRNVGSDQRLDTIMQMQLTGGGAGVTTPGSWKVSVANGTYNLTMAVGDPSYTDSHNVVNANGVKVVDFTPTTSVRQTTVTASVTVSNGYLLLDSKGGSNTKLDYLDLTSTTTGTTAPPSTTTTTSTSTTSTTSSTSTTTSTTVPPSTGGALSVTTPNDYLGVGNRLVWSVIANKLKPAQLVTLKNNGTGNLNITGLTIAGAQAKDFTLTSGQATNFTLAAGATRTVSVDYKPTGGGYHVLPTYISQGTLTIKSNDAVTPNAVVTLGGYNAADYGSYWEPSIQQMLNTLGYSTQTGVTNKFQANAISPFSGAQGDEVVSAFWQKADTTKPVSMYPLAHSSGKASSYPSFGWYAKGSGTNNFLYAFPGSAQGDNSNDGYGQNQILLPGTTTATRTFDPTGSFGFVDSQFNKSDDNANYGGKWHNIRWFPAKDASGKIIPNAYIVGDDIGAPINNSAKNWDYQDFVFLVTNVKPDGGNNQPTAVPLQQSLSSFSGTAGGIAGTGFTTAQGATDTSKIAFSNGQLKMSSTNDSNTSHTNALQLGINAGTGFQIQSRLVGPFDSINAGSEQQGIYFGPNGNNYIKAEVEWNPTAKARYLTVWREVNGTGAIIATTPLPNGNANTIDFKIAIDPAPQAAADYNGNPIVTITYSLNGAAFQQLFKGKNNSSGQAYIPSIWITSNTPAGIVTSHQEGGSPFIGTFANFSFSRTYP